MIKFGSSNKANFDAAKAEEHRLSVEIEKILSAAQAEERSLTAEEKVSLDNMTSERLKMEGAQAAMGRIPERLTSDNPLVGGYYTEPPKPKASGLSFRTQSGEMLTALTPADKLAGDVDPNMPSIGDLVVSALTGRKNESLGAVVAGVESSGGYTITPQASAMFLDALRAASVCQRAGALTVPLDSSEMTIAKLDSDATAVWRGETVAVTASQPSFGRITLKPKVLAAIVPASVELLEDSVNAGSIITSALASSLACELDRACLRGSGIGAEPAGIFATTGIGTVTTFGAPTNSDFLGKMIPAVYSILNANYPRPLTELSWVQHPRTWADVQSLVDSTYQPLALGPTLSQLQSFVTTGLSIVEGGGGAESSSVVGHFPSMLIGMRTGITVEILREGSVSDGTDTWNATTQLMRHIRIYLRADLALLRPSWFVRISGITT